MQKYYQIRKTAIHELFTSDLKCTLQQPTANYRHKNRKKSFSLCMQWVGAVVKGKPSLLAEAVMQKPPLITEKAKCYHLSDGPTDSLTDRLTDQQTAGWSAVHAIKNAKAYSLRFKSKLICSYNLHLSMKQTFSCLNTTLQNRRSSIYTPLSEWPQKKKGNIFLLSNAVKAIW